MSKVNYPNAVRQIPVHEHGSKAWLIERANTLGASELGKALGVSPYGGLLSLVIDKRQALAGNPEVISSDAMQDGQDAEDTVLRMAWRRLQQLAGGAYYSTPQPEMVKGTAIALGAVSATPDALIIESETGNAVSLIEAKLDRFALGTKPGRAHRFRHEAVIDHNVRAHDV